MFNSSKNTDESVKDKNEKRRQETSDDSNFEENSTTVQEKLDFLNPDSDSFDPSSNLNNIGIDDIYPSGLSHGDIFPSDPFSNKHIEHSGMIYPPPFGFPKPKSPIQKDELFPNKNIHMDPDNDEEKHGDSHQYEG